MSEAQQVAAAEEVQSGDAQVETTEATAEASAEAPAQVDKSAEDRAWQSRYDRLQQTVSKELLGYVNQYGGGQNIVGFLTQFESALGNPTLGPLVQSFLKTGQVELPKPKSEWEEPVQEDPWKPQFNSLLAELQSVKQSLTDMQRSQGMNAISEHTKKFLAEYPMDEREKQQFSDFMDTQWATLTASPQGTQLLKNIDYGSFKRLALPGGAQLGQDPTDRQVGKHSSADGRRGGGVPADCADRPARCTAAAWTDGAPTTADSAERAPLIECRAGHRKGTSCVGCLDC